MNKLRNLEKRLGNHRSSSQNHSGWKIESQIEIRKTNLDCSFFVTTNETQTINWTDPTFLWSSTENLWEESCFELFLKIGDRYWEWNFTPGGRSRAYNFDGWRNCTHKNTPILNPLAVETLNPGPEKKLGIRATIDFQSSPLLQWYFENAPHSIQYQSSCIISTHASVEKKQSFWASSPNKGDAPNFHSEESFLFL